MIRRIRLIRPPDYTFWASPTLQPYILKQHFLHSQQSKPAPDPFAFAQMWTHTALLEAGGMYASLVRRQLTKTASTAQFGITHSPSQIDLITG